MKIEKFNSKNGAHQNRHKRHAGPDSAFHHAGLDPASHRHSGLDPESICGRYDFTKMIQHFSGQTECKVMPCHSSEFQSPVTRPVFSVLDKTKIKETFGVEVPYWTDSLKKCIEHLIR